MRNFEEIVILTGAGVSAESGLSTFRDADGLWEKHRIEDVATPEAFARDPERVQNFYNLRRRQLDGVEPNAAHRALARLEAESPARVTIITQNVDDLHERAGSRNVLHMHGELKKARCTQCGRANAWEGDITDDSRCPSCGATGRLRPHVVWFGEIPLELDRIDRLLGTCDLFVSIGTSGAVYPAAGFVSQVRALGRAHTIELNLEPSAGSHFFHEARYGPAGAIVPLFVRELLTGGA